MFDFNKSGPFNSAISEHYDDKRDQLVERIHRVMHKDYKRPMPLADVPQPRAGELLEQLLTDWLADNFYSGESSIEVDPECIVHHVVTLRCAGYPNLESLSSLAMFAEWRYLFLKGLLVNQRRGRKLGELPLIDAETFERVPSPVLFLHDVRGEQDQEKGRAIEWDLQEVIFEVERQHMFAPTWVPDDALRLAKKLWAAYARTVSRMKKAGLSISLNDRALEKAREMLVSPAEAMPDYYGPQYRYGVNYPAATFLLAYHRARRTGLYSLND